jgi:hypothetical protein
MFDWTLNLYEGKVPVSILTTESESKRDLDEGALPDRLAADANEIRLESANAGRGNAE